jgi:release factor glutamine methyltransferase
VRHNESSIRSLLTEGESRLSEGPHPERARLDAETLLLHVLQMKKPEINRAWLITHGSTGTMPRVGQQMRVFVERRFSGEPIQYILGEAEFYGLPFHVTPDVLIPRPETEHLVEQAIQLAGEFTEPHIVDIGAGSGAIAIALAVHLPEAQITTIDVSAKALAIACENAGRNGVGERVRLLAGDLLEPVAGEQFDLVVSNPPYVPDGDRELLSVEVREHEPALALFAGVDGLDAYQRLIPAAYAALVPGGYVLLEIGYGQSEGVRALLAGNGFEAIHFVPDLQGIARVACGRRASATAVVK